MRPHVNGIPFYFGALNATNAPTLVRDRTVPGHLLGDDQPMLTPAAPQDDEPPMQQVIQ